MYHNKLLAAWYAPQTPQVSVPKWISCCNQSNGHLGGDAFAKYFLTPNRWDFVLLLPLSCSVDHFLGGPFLCFWCIVAWCLVVCRTCTKIAGVCVCVQKHFFNANFIYLLTPPWRKKLVMIFHSAGELVTDHSSCLLHWVNHICIAWDFCDFQSIGVDWQLWNLWFATPFGRFAIMEFMWFPIHWVDWQLWNLWFATPFGRFAIMEFMISTRVNFFE